MIVADKSWRHLVGESVAGDYDDYEGAGGPDDAGDYANYDDYEGEDDFHYQGEEQYNSDDTNDQSLEYSNNEGGGFDFS